MSKLSKYFILILAVLSLVVILQNMAIVSVAFLFWQFSMPRAVLICLMLVIGLLIGLLLKNHRK